MKHREHAHLRKVIAQGVWWGVITVIWAFFAWEFHRGGYTWAYSIACIPFTLMAGYGIVVFLSSVLDLPYPWEWFHR